MSSGEGNQEHGVMRYLGRGARVRCVNERRGRKRRREDATRVNGARRGVRSGPPRQGRTGHDGSTYRVPHDLLVVRSSPPPGVV